MSIRDRIPWRFIWFVAVFGALAFATASIFNAYKTDNQELLKNKAIFVALFLAMWAAALPIIYLSLVALFALGFRLDDWVNYRSRQEKPPENENPPTGIRRGRRFKGNRPRKK